MTVHHKKSGIYRKKFTGFQYDLDIIQEHHKSLVNGSKIKRIGLDKIMPLWPKNIEKTTRKKYQNSLAVSSKHEN